MICGINWGGEPTSSIDLKSEMQGTSFFSDSSMNNQKDNAPNRFNNRIVEWFRILGHPLETAEEKAGDFEKSIFQTNWLPTKSRSVDSKTIKRYCIDHPGNFEYHVLRFKPKLIMFFSVMLFDVLNSKDSPTQVRKYLGIPSGDRRIIQKRNIVVGTKVSTAFRVGIQRFSNANVIAFPHPTPQRNSPSDKYIAAFKHDICPLINEYKEKRKSKLSTKSK